MFIQRVDIPLVTIADGSCTALSPVLSGRVLAVIYTKNNFTDGANLTVTANVTGEPIVTLTAPNATAIRYPRVGVHDATGAAATLDGTHAMREPVALANDQVKVVVAAGGNATLGTMTVVLG